MHTEISSWLVNANHKQFFDHDVLNEIIIVYKDYNYRNEMDHVIGA